MRLSGCVAPNLWGNIHRHSLLLHESLQLSQEILLKALQVLLRKATGLYEFIKVLAHEYLHLCDLIR